MSDSKIVEKVWGTETWITNTWAYCSKLLHVRAGFVCSDHCHLVKDETFYVLSGMGAIAINGGVRRLNCGDTVRLTPGQWHRFGSCLGMTLIETSTHHEDSDVQRHDESHQLSWDNDDDASMLEAMGATRG